MSWFDDNAAALAEAGISQETAKDFERRNPGDTHRIFEAYAEDEDKKESPPQTQSLGNFYQSTYRPFTEEFVAPEAPSDLMDPWKRTFKAEAPTMPADLMEAWNKSYTRPTATDLLSDPGYEARQAAQQRGMERSAAAKGTLLTGGLQRSLADYGQELASNEYQRLADRSMSEYLNAFNVFTTDKARRTSTFGDQFGQAQSTYQTDFNVDQADKSRRGAEFGNTYNRKLGEYGQRFNIDTTNQMNTAGINAQNFGMDLSNRQFAAGRDDAMWNRNRTGYLDDFNIWHTVDSDWWDRNLKLGDYGRPN